MSNDTAQALNRVADALFQCATEQRRQTRLQERAVTVSEKMLEMQQVNLNVSKALESRLLMEQNDVGAAYAGS